MMARLIYPVFIAIAVRGDPLADISILESVEVVIKGGARFK